ncbi:MAG: glutamate 5-kinase [Planctomycetota bacterium]
MHAARPWIVKVGTAVLSKPDGRPDEAWIAAFAADVAAARRAGRPVCVVTSGAIGAGMGELGLLKRPGALAELQGAAAVGQALLMRIYHDAFAAHGLKTAQVLLTREDFAGRARDLNVRSTLERLLAWGVVPIVNENDTVSSDEIRFGDNDILSALLANSLRSEWLMLLTTVEGVLRSGPDGAREVVRLVPAVDASVRRLALAEKSARGSGGMRSKIDAAGLANRGGARVLIAAGRPPGILARVLSGERPGTLFLPAPKGLSGRRRWIAGGAAIRGALRIDAGAETALKKGGKSLLAAGITLVTGRFKEGDVVSVEGPDGAEIGRGVAGHPAAVLDRIKGLARAEAAAVLGGEVREAIHRDELVVWEAG